MDIMEWGWGVYDVIANDKSSSKTIFGVRHCL